MERGFATFLTSALCRPFVGPSPQTSPGGHVGPMSALYITIVGPPHVRFPMSALCRPLEYIFPWKAYVCSQKTPLRARRAEVDLGADHGLGFYLDRNSDNVMAPFGRSSHVG